MPNRRSIEKTKVAPRYQPLGLTQDMKKTLDSHSNKLESISTD